MKKSACFVFFVLLSTLSVSSAIDDVQMLPTRKKLDEDQARSSDHTSVKSKQIIYSVKVNSRAFKELNNVTIKYNIYYEVSQLGSTAKPEVKSASGSHSLESLLTNKPVEFDTTAIQLNQETLDGRYYFGNGAASAAKDKVVGLWFKAFDAEGKLIGEYMNPASVATKQKWKE